MADMGRVLGDAGAPVELPIAGTVWKLSRLTKRRQAAYAEWHKGRVRGEAIALKGVLPADDYAANLAAVTVALGDPSHSWGGAACMASVQSLDGLTRLLWLVLEPNHAGLTEEAVGELILSHLDELKTALESLLPKSDPNAKAPAAPKRAGRGRK